MRYKLFITLVLIYCTSILVVAQENTSPQKILIIRNAKKKKRAYYSENSAIIIKTKDTTYYGTIKTIENDSLLIDSTWTDFNNIVSVINTDGRHFIKSGSVMFPIAGMAYTFITTINALTNNERPIFYFEATVPSLSLVGLGVLMWPFRNKHYHMKSGWELYVLEI